MKNTLRMFAVFFLSTIAALSLHAQNAESVEPLLADLAGGNDGDVELQTTNKTETVTATTSAAKDKATTTTTTAEQAKNAQKAPEAPKSDAAPAKSK